MDEFEVDLRTPDENDEQQQRLLSDAHAAQRQLAGIHDDAMLLLPAAALALILALALALALVLPVFAMLLNIWQCYCINNFKLTIDMHAHAI